MNLYGRPETRVVVELSQEDGRDLYETRPTDCAGQNEMMNNGDAMGRSGNSQSPNPFNPGCFISK